jgi:hypothetical protein
MSKLLIENLVNYIESNYSPEKKIKKSKDGSETTFFRKGGKSLCYINKKDGVYAITVVIGASLNDQVQSANISKKAKEMFEEAKQFHDGKWLNFECSTKQDVDDIQTLLTIKKPLVKK